MLRRLRTGKRSARGGYNDVSDQGSHQDDEYATHTQQNNESTPYPASPPRRSANAGKKSSSFQAQSRTRLDRLARDHLSHQQQRSITQPAFDTAHKIVDSPDDVSRGFTSLTYESSLTGASNASKSRNADNSVSFSTIWEREEADVEHVGEAPDPESTPMRVAEARRSAMNIALKSRVTSNAQRNAYQSASAKHRLTTRTASKIKNGHGTTQQPPMNNAENRRQDYAYRSSPPQQQKPMNSSKRNEALEMEKKEDSPHQSFIASSAPTQTVNNGTNHLIKRIIKKHQYQTDRSKSNRQKATMDPLQQADLDPTTAPTKNVRHYQAKAARRKSSGQKHDPASNTSAVDPPPDPPAEEWKRPAASTYSKHSSSSSKFWDEVEKFPVIKEERELQQFFQQNLVQVTKEPVDLEQRVRMRAPKAHQAAAVPQQKSEPAQDETDNFSNAFSLNLNVDKLGRFDDSDISALEMFDSATVYHQTALAVESGDVHNYWKLKYDRLKKETRAAMKQRKIVEEEEPDEVEEKQKQSLRRDKRKKSKDELNRIISGKAAGRDDGAPNSPFCRDGLSQTMDVLMQKVNEIENVSKQKIEHLIEDTAIAPSCEEIAEKALYPAVISPQQREQDPQQQREEQPRKQENLMNRKSLADDLTAGLASRIDRSESHIIDSDAVETQRHTPRTAPNEREISSTPVQKQDRPDSIGKEEHLHQHETNVITPEKSASSPGNKQLHSGDGVTHPMLRLGSLYKEAITSERVKQSLLHCSDSVMFQYLSSPNSNQLAIPSRAIPNSVDPQEMMRLCQNPQFIGKSISQTIVRYGKKVLQKREVISELNQNILRFGARHPLVGESHLKVGLLHMYDGQYPHSILHLEEALKINATFLEPNHSDLSSILMFIALGQLALERFDDCMASLLGVRRLRENVVGPTHPEIGLILNNIACVHYEIGEPNRAETLFQEALDLQREAFTTEPAFLKSVSTLLSNIAFLHAKNGLFPKALIELEGALQIQQEILSDEGNESDAILENIAHIMAIQKMQHGSGNMEEITNQYMTMLMRR